MRNIENVVNKEEKTFLDNKIVSIASGTIGLGLPLTLGIVRGSLESQGMDSEYVNQQLAQVSGSIGLGIGSLFGYNIGKEDAAKYLQNTEKGHMFASSHKAAMMLGGGVLATTLSLATHVVGYGIGYGIGSLTK